jgi:hypothetical protein
MEKNSNSLFRNTPFQTLILYPDRLFKAFKLAPKTNFGMYQLVPIHRQIEYPVKYQEKSYQISNVLLNLHCTTSPSINPLQVHTTSREFIHKVRTRNLATIPIANACSFERDRIRAGR